MAKSLELDADLQLLPVPTTPIFQRSKVGLVVAVAALALSASACSGDDDDSTPTFDGGIYAPDSGPSFDAGIIDMGRAVFDGGVTFDAGSVDLSTTPLDAAPADAGPPLVFDGGVTLPEDGGAD